MNTEKTVNIPLLRTIYDENPKIKALIDLYAVRKRGRFETTFPRMYRLTKENDIDMSKKELADFYKSLQEAGAGRCVSGRNGKMSRFYWDFHLKSVAEAVKNYSPDKPAELKKPSKKKVKLPKVKPVQAAEASPVAAEIQPSKAEASPTVAEPIAPIATETKRVIVKHAGFQIEFPMDMSSDDWKDAATFLNNLRATG